MLYEFPGDDIPSHQGQCSQGSRRSFFSEAAGAITELMAAVDDYIDIPERDNAKDFLMPVEDVFSIEGRGTVVTGRIECWSPQGLVTRVEIVGDQRH